MPEGQAPTHCRFAREVQFRLNRIAVAQKALALNPHALGLKENLIKKKNEYRDACKTLCMKIVERDIDKMQKFSRVKPDKFFAATGLHMKFDGPLGLCPRLK